MENRITGKVIIITGASGGLGSASAKDLAANGAKVVLAARQSSKLETLCAEIKKAGGNAVWKQTDVTDKEQVKALMDYAMKEYGRIDVLINNAGTMPGSFLYKNNTEEWDNLIDINIKGVLYGIGAALPYMRAQKSGHIINIASTAAYEDTLPGVTVYYATKAAVRVISDGLRREEDLSGSGIRVTDICPGMIDTDLKYTVTDPEMKAMVMQAYSQKALSPEDMARAIHYAVNEPEHIAVNEIIVRPNAQ